MTTQAPIPVHDSAPDAEVAAQLCAYNAAFDELGLRFRWDERTLISLAAIVGEEAQIAAYVEAHHSHLLHAYSVEFLSHAILEKKYARYPQRLQMRVEQAPRPGHEMQQTQTNRRAGHFSFSVELPALAGV